MIIEYALLAFKNIDLSDLMSSAASLIEDYKLFVAGILLFIILFIITKKW